MRSPQVIKMSTRFHPLLKRLLWGIVTLWGVSVITFLLLFVLPRFGRNRNVKSDDATKIQQQMKDDDPATTMMAMTIAGAHADPETIANIKKERGLDKPLPIQYSMFVRDALTNNLRSYRNGDRVMSAIARRFPATLALAIAAILIYLVVAIPLGLRTAQNPGGGFDRVTLFLGLFALSLPTFWLGRLLQQYVGYQWNIFSVGGGASLWNLPLPALTLGIGGAAYYARLLHANLRGVLRQDFVRSARARGLNENRVLVKHALKNALIPLVTVLGMEFASLLSGLIFTEKIFAWPGIGSLVVDSVTNYDVPMIMGTVLFTSFVVVVMNILVDLAYGLIDPRVRLS
jgi:peptide/nickel transport system permease protein